MYFSDDAFFVFDGTLFYKLRWLIRKVVVSLRSPFYHYVIRKSEEIGCDRGKFSSSDAHVVSRTLSRGAKAAKLGRKKTSYIGFIILAYVVWIRSIAALSATSCMGIAYSVLRERRAMGGSRDIRDSTSILHGGLCSQANSGIWFRNRVHNPSTSDPDSQISYNFG